jgi:hypothetical protein
MHSWEVYEAINTAIERFAKRLADELEQSGAGTTIHDTQLREIAHWVREAGKSPRTRRREARETTKGTTNE